MKLIIDIPEDVYIRLKDDEHMIRDVVGKFGGTAGTQANLAILNGTPYEERPKGKWVKNFKSLWDLGNCSECGYFFVGTREANFCPKCGARMER